MISFEEVRKLKAEGKLIVLALDRKRVKPQARQNIIFSLLSENALTSNEIVEKCLKTQLFNNPRSIRQALYNLNHEKKLVGFFSNGNYYYVAFDRAKELG